jgi:2-succinyl-6-hydroxy-2,4-cyclohexadiene-1-carboxylate synthase
MIVSVRGIEMHGLVAGSGPALLLLHGCTGSSETWRPFLPQLAAHRRVIAPDLIGHGRTVAPADAVRYRMDECVADVLGLLDRLGVEGFATLGYSLGGRVALHLALAVPERVRALIVASASPGIANAEERAERARSDQTVAELIEREGIAAFVERWETQPLFASLRSLPAEVRARLRAERLRQRPCGLANSLRGMDAGAMEPI